SGPHFVREVEPGGPNRLPFRHAANKRRHDPCPPAAADGRRQCDARRARDVPATHRPRRKNRGVCQRVGGSRVTPDLIQIAHDALCRNPAPFLRHYKRGRFAERHGAFYSGNELPGPGFNFASCVGPTGSLAEVVEFGREFFADAAEGWGVLVEGGAGHPVETEMLAAGW